MALLLLSFVIFNKRKEHSLYMILDKKIMNYTEITHIVSLKRLRFFSCLKPQTSCKSISAYSDVKEVISIDNPDALVL